MGLRRLLGLKQPRPPGVIDRIQNLGERVRSLVHVGANTGEEARYYHRSGVETAIYIEPIDEVFAALAERVAPLGRSHIPIKALCAEEDGRTVEFHIASNGGASSSMLEFGWCQEEHPNVNWVGHRTLTTQRLDTVLDQLPLQVRTNIDLLIMDTQGTELRVLEGAPLLVKRVRWIYTEVSEGGLYNGDCSLEEMQAYLFARGFRMRHLEMNRHRWGDALFARVAG